MPDLQHTPLHDHHAQRGAQFVDFAGWAMPLRYDTSILDEHHATRTAGGLFDVSHMGRLRVTGRHARKFVERVVTRRVTVMKPGQCRYALVCNEQGNVLDDIIVYRFDDDWLLVVNASNRAKLLAHFAAVLETEGFNAKLKDETEKTAMIAIQGPKVMDTIARFSESIPKLKRYTFAEKNLLIVKMTVSRTGYTGEDGVEIILNASMASKALAMLIKKDDDTIKPAGLGARDTLRTEAGMPLYGHELDEDTNPLEAGLHFAVNLDKGTGEGKEVDGPPVPRFIGQDALQRVAEQGVAKTLVGLTLDSKRTPRQGARVLQNNDELGVVTSGCNSPTLGHPIAMAYVKPDTVKPGDTVQIDIGSKTLDATVAPLPFYKRPN